MISSGVFSLKSLFSACVTMVLKPPFVAAECSAGAPQPVVFPAAPKSVAIPLKSVARPNQALARQAALFAPENDNNRAVLNDIIQRSLKSEPYLLGSSVKEVFSYSSMAANSDLEAALRRYQERTFSIPRFESLLFSLIQTLPEQTRRLTYVENGPGAMCFTSLLLAGFGHEVIIKEPERACHRLWSKALQSWFPKELSARVRLLRTIEEIEEPSPAEIVFWSHPNPYMIIGDASHPASKEDIDPTEYLGRDVKPGGFLVLQTDSSSYQSLVFPEERWESIFETPTPIGLWPQDFVLPTEYHNFPAALRVFRRRP